MKTTQARQPSMALLHSVGNVLCGTVGVSVAHLPLAFITPTVLLGISITAVELCKSSRMDKRVLGLYAAMFSSLFASELAARSCNDDLDLFPQEIYELMMGGDRSELEGMQESSSPAPLLPATWAAMARGGR